MVGEDFALSTTCIGHLWIFENLLPEQLDTLSKGSLRKKYQRGQAIFSQEEPANKMFLLKAGRVKLSKVTEDGTQITLDIRRAGDFLGENMLGQDMDYPGTAWCMEDTPFCGFSKEGFENLVLDNPNIGLQGIKNLSNRISWFTSRVGSMSFTNLEERLCGVFTNVALSTGRKARKTL
jgi:CRP/FNR family transcriptional regulator